jgi:tetratricopeptide (TPR) repeat protein
MRARIHAGTLTMIVAAVLTVSIFAAAQAPQQPPPQPVKLYDGMGTLHHAIHTSNPEAQKFFDQGLTLVYGFNHEQAIRSFERASELDPAAAMPYWGKALALGPNYNADIDLEREKGPYATILKAKELAAAGPENERDYVSALARRYSDDPKADLKKLALDYANAMRDLAHKYPNDPDAQVIFAESLMDLHPWQLWSVDGKPNENTLEIIATLEAVLKRWPNHPGANHYYIHALEASPNPERAQMSADRLGNMVPSAGHLVHMPAHIYLRTGNYAAAVKANQDAIASDLAFLQATGTSSSMYGIMYLTHNIDFLYYAAGMNGQFKVSLDAANMVADNARPALDEIPMAEITIPEPMMPLLRFAKWDEVLKLPIPNPKFLGATMYSHFGRGVAFAEKGQLVEAEAERKAFAESAAKLPAGPAFGMLYNEWSVITEIAGHVLEARIAAAASDAANGIPATNAGNAVAIDHWRQAVAIQDKMNYDEPPEWYYPVRESLGAALLRSGKSAEAEAVFREDLKFHPNNPRALFGLWKSLDAQKKAAEAQRVRTVFVAAWKDADVQLRIEDF